MRRWPSGWVPDFQSGQTGSTPVRRSNARMAESADAAESFERKTESAVHGNMYQSIG